MVGLFGANGDAAGLATVTWPQIDVQFSSATGGVGQLAGLPVMVISVPVLASAAGRTVAVSATSPDSSVSVTSGSVSVKGTLSVEKIPAGMGVVAAGTVVPVNGTGFTASTTVTIDGVEIASTRFVSAKEIDVTIGGAAELVGKLARVTDSGVEFDYFCFQPNDPVNFPEKSLFGSAVANVQPLFPLVVSTGFRGGTGNSGYPGYVIEVENPNPAAATVSLANYSVCCGPLPNVSPETLSIPAGSWAIFDGRDQNFFVMNSNLPVRVVELDFCSANVGPPVCLATPVPYDVNALGPPAITPSSLAFAWQMGSSTLPAARTVSLSGSLTQDATIAATTTSGQSWLSVSSQAVPCQLHTFCFRESLATRGWNVSRIDPGERELRPAGDAACNADRDRFRRAGDFGQSHEPHLHGPGLQRDAKFADDLGHERLRTGRIFGDSTTGNVAEGIADERHHARNADGDMGPSRNVADLLPAAFDSRIDFDQRARECDHGSGNIQCHWRPDVPDLPGRVRDGAQWTGVFGAVGNAVPDADDQRGPGRNHLGDGGSAVDERVQLRIVKPLP